MNIGLQKITDSKPHIPARAALAMPRHWHKIPDPTGFCAAFQNTLSGLRATVTLDTMEDGATYTHVSCSYPHKLPSWDDLKQVKDAFIGPHREAIQVLPKDEDYVNVHPYCLHLWAEE